jgi:ATP-dependent Clp protease ATP-binding subunit ClpA
LLNDQTASKVLYHCGGDLQALRIGLEKFFDEQKEGLRGNQVENQSELPEQTELFQRVLQYSQLQAEASGQSEVNGGHLLAALFAAELSHAVYLLKKQGISRLDVLKYISHGISKVSEDEGPVFGGESTEVGDVIEQPSRDPLKSFTINLIESAASGQIDSLIGRAAELQRTIQILCRRLKNNPIYVGEPGVGKTAIAEGLALKIHLGDVPDVLRSAKIYALDMGAVLAGTKYRGEFEQRFKGVLSALHIPDSIIFSDEIIPLLAQALSVEGIDGRSNFKRRFLRGLRCIGSTTYSEYSLFDRNRATATRLRSSWTNRRRWNLRLKAITRIIGVRYIKALRGSRVISQVYARPLLPDKAIDADEASERQLTAPARAENRST